MRNTEYSSRLTGPLRAPTMRSAPEIVFVKLVRASVRTRSTPIKRATLTATDSTVSPAVSRRFSRLFAANEKRIALARIGHPFLRRSVDLGHRDGALE